MSFRKYLYEEMDQAVKNQAEALARILAEHKGHCTAVIDNDNWQILIDPPEGYEEWNEDAQDEWYETKGVVANNHEFPDLGNSYGYGVLEALALAAEIKVESV